MARPWRDPKSGMFYLRTRIPRHVLPDARGTNVVLPIGDEHVAVTLGEMAKASLRTRDPAEAKVRYVAASAALAAHFDALRTGPVRLSRRQVAAIAGTVYNDHAESLSDEPGEAGIWTHVLRLHAEARAKGRLEQWVGPLVDAELAKLHIIAHPESRAALIEEIDRALIQKAETFKRFSEGDFRPDPDAGRFPDPVTALAPLAPVDGTVTTAPKKAADGGLSILDVWDKFRTTPPLPASSTIRRWGPAIAAFHEFIGQRGMDTVTSGDAMLFADHRVADGISPTSASKVDVAAVKRMFSFAQARGLLTTNPLAGMRRERRGNENTREREGKDFHPHEYRLILRSSAAIYDQPGERGQTLLDAIRWVPWICAYSGARPGEAVQLRKEDFGEEDGVPFHFIRDGAGTVKTGKGRRTPIHAHLVELGLLEFVRRAKPGHLFVNVVGEDAEAVERAIATTRGRLGNWVRDIGVTDKEISPNHAWRHTFKTIAQDADLPEKVVEAICGHAPTTQGRKYGKVSLVAKAALLEAFPRYALDEPRKSG